MVMLALSILFAQDRTFIGFPKHLYKPAMTVGQREIILGPVPQPDTVMEVRYEKEQQAEFTNSAIFGGTDIIYAKGYVRWSVTEGTMFNKQCLVIKTDGITKGEIKTKTKRLEYANQNTTTWWTQPDGKLLREAIALSGPEGQRKAEIVFWPDHLEVSVSQGNERKSYTLFPNIDMSLFHTMFKPMVEGDKITQTYKEFYTFDPFTKEFTKYKAFVSGNFKGTWLGEKFEGKHFNIDTDKVSQVAFLSKENDLIKVDLPDDTSIVLNFLPHGRDKFYKATAGKSSGN